LKKFEFTLQRILAFKRTIYEKERNTLAQMRAERATVEARMENTIAQRFEKEEEFKEKAVYGFSALELREHNFYVESAMHLVEELKLDLARRDFLIEKQLNLVMELDKEKKSLEKLRESQWEEYQAEALLKERERILEMVSGRFAEEQKQIAN
jgi:flagellar FliJ protein